MEAYSNAKSSQKLIKELTGLASTVSKNGRRRNYDTAAKELAVSAILSGIPKSRLAKILKVSWGTIDYWLETISPKLQNHSPHPSDSSIGESPTLRTLKVQEPLSSLPLGGRQSIEIQVGNCFIRVTEPGGLR